MRLEFDRKVPIDVQIARRMSAQKPGRKHDKRPGQKALDRKNASKVRGEKEKRRKIWQHKQNVKKYWCGKIEEYPEI